jgi:hypothetical protein
MSADEEARLIAHLHFAGVVESLRAQVARLRDALEYAQWGSCDGCGSMRYCPECGTSRDFDKHIDKCSIGAALRSTTSSPT